MSADRQVRERLAEVRTEQLLRSSRSDLLSYAHMVMPFYRANWHHGRIAAALMDVERGVIDRLMIVTPPRHGKSLMCSVIFPAWYMGRNPTKEIIAASYGTELVAGFGTRLRNLMSSEMQGRIFGADALLAKDTRARDRWLTASGGVYRAAGVGAGITGFGSHLSIIDDPVKSREEAESPVMRARVWDWYQNDLYSRRMKGGAIVVVQTRWHEDDLAGRLLAEQETGGDKWEILHYPAIDDMGRALWPDEYPVADLERTRRVIGPRAWQALYQGSPTPEEGAYFKSDWLVEYRTEPDVSRMRIYGASDYAVTDGAGDWTVHVVVGVDSDDVIWILDMWRGQTASDEWVERLLDLMKKWKPIVWGEESGQIMRAVGPYILRRQRERKVWGARQQYSSSSDKPTRARAIQARTASKMLRFPANADWWPVMRDELLKFPVAKNDDIVDALSLVGRMLDILATGKGVAQVPREPGALVVGGNVALPAGYEYATYGDIVAETRRQRREAGLT